MTEGQWLQTDNLEWAVEQLFCARIVADRKFRLYACACCRRIESLLPTPDYSALLTVAEQYAEGDVRKPTIVKHARKLRELLGSVSVSEAAENPEDAAREAVIQAASFPESYKPDYYALHDTCPYPSWAAAFARYAIAGEDQERGQVLERQQLQLLRDVFGNPFRPITFSPSWRTDTAISLARTMYESRDFSAMPILADALQDAGCDNTDILSHCRDANQVHVRGCWVVDLVLGKA